MEGALVKGILALLMGSALLWVGWNHWRHRNNEEAIPFIERKLLDMGGQEPLPRTGYDWWAKRVQAGLGLMFGAFWCFVGVLLIFS